MRVSDAYQGTYISCEAWPEKPTPHVISEAGLDDDTFSKADGAKQVYIRLDGKDEKYRVNKTNASELVKAWGDELDEWEGKTILLSREIQSVKGKRTWVGILQPGEQSKGSTAKKKK